MANIKKDVGSRVKKLTSGESVITVSLTVPPDVLEEIDVAAAKSLRTRAAEMRLRLEWSLAQTKAGKRLE